MFSIILGILVCLIPTVVITMGVFSSQSGRWDQGETTLAAFGCSFILFGFLGLATMNIGIGLNGLYPGYSTGERIGFVTKASTKGIFFVTNEIEMQMGTGQMASLQDAHEMSVPNQTLFTEMSDQIGRKVKIEYKQWLSMPWRMGKTDYEVTKVTFLDKQNSTPTESQIPTPTPLPKK